MPLKWTPEKAHQEPRCRQADVDSDWWIDPDLQGADSRAQHTTHGNRLRAKLFCYECPFLYECRELGWDEPAHVWGGLTFRDRCEARRRGFIRHIDDKYLYWGAKTPPTRTLYEQVEKMFRNGKQPDDIAATLGISGSTVSRFLWNFIDVARRKREEEDGVWQSPIPPLDEQGLKILLNGRGVSARSLMEISA